MTDDTCTATIPSPIIESYSMGNISEVKPIDRGLVNTTFKVESEEGEFVVQKLHKMFSSDLIDDQKLIIPFLKNEKVPAPQLIANNEGNFSITHEGYLWRVFNHIANENVEITEEHIRSAARSLAHFHKVGLHVPHKPIFQLKDFHNTEKIIEKMKLVFKKNNPESEKVRNQYEFILSKLNTIELPISVTTLIHGDPKLDNFLFKGNAVVGFVDYDTMMWANPLIDIGDALRSWCREGTKFNKKIFEIAKEAYLEEFPIEHSEYFGDAMKIITLELASRYLIDYFEKSYFLWDNDRFNSASENHLFKCNELIEYFRDIERTQ